MKKFFLALACVFGALSASAQFSIDLKPGGMMKLLQARSALLRMYVDTLNEERLTDDAIRGMLEQLDPHTQYSTAEEARRMTEMFEGHFDGIGIRYVMQEDTLLVIKTIAGGPSEKAGLQAGDRIITVNDSLIAGVKMKQDDVYKRLRGKSGSKVRVGVKRKGEKGLLQFELKRAAISTPSINCAYMIRPKVGYIRLETFAKTTYDEFMTTVHSLQKKGMQTLILDLQGNTGGILDVAVRMVNEFLQKDELIVYGEGVHYERKDYRATGSGTLKQMPIYVLINNESASASEIVAGALQDHDRATIVGLRSFGKGCIQSPLMLGDGSMLRVTVAHFYTPSGRCIQKPFEKGHRKEYQNEVFDREKTGEIFTSDSIHVNDSLRFYTLKRHRTVYGGGGIIPDEFVPIDTTLISRWFTKMVAKGIVVEKTTRYWDNHREKLLSHYPTFNSFAAGFSVPEHLIDTIVKAAEAQNILPAHDTDRQNGLLRLRKYICILLANDLYDDGAGMRLGNNDNQILQHTLQMLP